LRLAAALLDIVLNIATLFLVSDPRILVRICLVQSVFEVTEVDMVMDLVEGGDIVEDARMKVYFSLAAHDLSIKASSFWLCLSLRFEYKHFAFALTSPCFLFYEERSSKRLANRSSSWEYRIPAASCESFVFLGVSHPRGLLRTIRLLGSIASPWPLANHSSSWEYRIPVAS
jgi:hypothetical protein